MTKISVPRTIPKRACQTSGAKPISNSENPPGLLPDKDSTNFEYGTNRKLFKIMSLSKISEKTIKNEAIDRRASA